MSRQKILQKAVTWGRRKSPWIIHFNAGACNGCDTEALAVLAPRFDAEVLGIMHQGTPRQADILVCTGAVMLETRDRLRQIYDQMAEPKFVVAVGACACSGGVFGGCYGVVGGIDTTIPVDAYLPGCAVHPQALIDALDKLLTDWQKNQEQALKMPPVAVPKDLPLDPPEPEQSLEEGRHEQRR